MIVGNFSEGRFKFTARGKNIDKIDLSVISHYFEVERKKKNDYKTR